MKSWNLLQPDPDLCARIATEAGTSDILARLLVNRRIDSPEAARTYLEPHAQPLHDPFLLPDMAPAVERLVKAIAEKERILVHGDYDVDGLTGTAIVAGALSHLGLEVFTFIPDRLEDGYGVSETPLMECPEKGISLLITVDCGVSAVSALNNAQSIGLDVIVTDHHLPGEALPPAVALVDPHLSDSSPNRDLAGAGVAYHLIRALKKTLGDRIPEVPDMIDLAALGTLADAMKVTGENRTIIARGMELLRNTDRPGILGLLDHAGLVAADLSSENIIYGLTPRLNALGRMGSASVGLKLLMTENWAKAKELSLLADETNKQRKRLQDRNCKAIDMMLAVEPEQAEEAALVFWDREWHRGVIGIVASKLVDRYHRPAFVLAIDEEGIAHGSARSPEGYDVSAGLASVTDILLSHGGHAGAGGFHLKEEHLETFREEIRRHVRENYDPEKPHGTCDIDAEVTLDQIDLGVLEEINRMEPFGSGNPHPLFLARGVKTQCELQIVGNQHLKLGCHQGPASMPGIAFGKGDLLDRADLSEIDILFEPFISRWRGRSRLEIRIDEIRPASKSRAPRTSSSAPFTSSAPCILRDHRGRKFPKTGGPSEEQTVLFMTGCDEVAATIMEGLAKPDRKKGFFESVIDVERQVHLLVYNGAEGPDRLPEETKVDHVIFWDLPRERESLKEPLRHTAYGAGAAALHLAYSEKSFEEARKRLRRRYPDRALLGDVYRRLAEILDGREAPKMEISAKLLSAEICPEVFQAALHVLGEIGLLQEKEETVLLLKPKGKRDLSESVHFRAGANILAEYEKLGRFLLRSSLEQIDRYFRSILR